MKKVFLMMLALLMAACGKSVDEQADDGMQSVVFHVSGDFRRPTFTRGELTADGKEMTDLWCIDYVDGACVQVVRQTEDDADWGSPVLSLTIGSHTVYFVASRGDEPTLDEDNGCITWSVPRDTFLGSVSLTVSSSGSGSRSVTLDRVATKLKLTVADEVPSTLSQIDIKPAHWYYGLDYVTGEAVDDDDMVRTVNVPSTYHGTAGSLSLSIYGISTASEWTTDLTVTAKDGDGGSISTVSIPSAPFKANRTTEYAGRMFSSGEGFGISLNTEWLEPLTGTW